MAVFRAQKQGECMRAGGLAAGVAKIEASVCRVCLRADEEARAIGGP